MSDQNTEATKSTEATDKPARDPNKPQGPKLTPKKEVKFSKKTLRKLGREKRFTRLMTDVEFRKAFHDGKAKRSDARKAAFRKRHAKQAT